MTKCVFAGSFDPMTIGHINIIEQALTIFSLVNVLVCSHKSKAYWLSLDMRYNLAQKSTSFFKSSVSVMSCRESVVKFMKENNILHTIRGLRSSYNVHYENHLYDVNNNISPHVCSVIFLSKSHLRHISSTLVRDTLKYSNNIHHLVDSSIVDFLLDNAHTLKT